MENKQNNRNFINLKNFFPNFELSYEYLIHKKVDDYSLVFALPKGYNIYLWFFTFDSSNIIAILFLQNDIINNIKIIYKEDKINSHKNNNILNQLNGTILKGIVSYNNNFSCSVNNINFIFLEDLIYYKTEFIYKDNYVSKLNIIKSFIFDINNILNKIINKDKYYRIGLPIFDNDYFKLLKNIENISYKIEFIKFLNFNNNKIYKLKYYNNSKNNILIPTIKKSNIIFLKQEKETEKETEKEKEKENEKETEKEINTNVNTNSDNDSENNSDSDNDVELNNIYFHKLKKNNLVIKKFDINKSKININFNSTQSLLIFNVRPSLQNDIYNLYSFNYYKNKEDFYDIALIQDYKTSVFMNKLFRNIKENKNLDYLEESSNEEDFENDDVNKYVDLTKNYKMYCIFNKKFNKYQPISLAPEKCNIIDTKFLSKNIKKYKKNIKKY